MATRVVTFDVDYPGGQPRSRGTMLVQLIDRGTGSLANGRAIAGREKVRLGGTTGDWAAGHGEIELQLNYSDDPNERISPEGTAWRLTVEGTSPLVVHHIQLGDDTPDRVDWLDSSIEVEDTSRLPPSFVQQVGPKGDPGDNGVVHADLPVVYDSDTQTIGVDQTALTVDPTQVTGLAANLAGKQPLDGDLTAIAALSTTPFGRALLTLANAAAGQTAFGLGTAATHAAGDFETPTGAQVKVDAAVSTLLGGAPPQALDTLAELATQLQSDESAAAALTTVIAGKQPIDSDLTAIAALATTAFGRALLTMADAGALRTAAGLGTAAQAATGDFDAAGAAAAAQAASQPLDSDLTAIALMATTSFGRGFLALADATAFRTYAGLGSASTHPASDFETPSGAQAKADQVKSDLLGGAPPAALDTLLELGSQLQADESAAAALTTAVAGKQPLDGDLTAIAALSTTPFGRALLALADAVALRTAAGLGTAATHPATDFDAAGAATTAQANAETYADAGDAGLGASLSTLTDTMVTLLAAKLDTGAADLAGGYAKLDTGGGVQAVELPPRRGLNRAGRRMAAALARSTGSLVTVAFISDSYFWLGTTDSKTKSAPALVGDTLARRLNGKRRVGGFMPVYVRNAGYDWNDPTHGVGVTQRWQTVTGSVLTQLGGQPAGTDSAHSAACIHGFACGSGGIFDNTEIAEDVVAGADGVEVFFTVQHASGGTATVLLTSSTGQTSTTLLVGTDANVPSSPGYDSGRSVYIPNPSGTNRGTLTIRVTATSNNFILDSYRACNGNGTVGICEHRGGQSGMTLYQLVNDANHAAILQHVRNQLPPIVPLIMGINDHADGIAASGAGDTFQTRLTAAFAAIRAQYVFAATCAGSTFTVATGNKFKVGQYVTPSTSVDGLTAGQTYVVATATATTFTLNDEAGNAAGTGSAAVTFTATLPSIIYGFQPAGGTHSTTPNALWLTDFRSQARQTCMADGDVIFVDLSEATGVFGPGAIGDPLGVAPLDNASRLHPGDAGQAMMARSILDAVVAPDATSIDVDTITAVSSSVNGGVADVYDKSHPTYPHLRQRTDNIGIGAFAYFGVHLAPAGVEENWPRARVGSNTIGQGILAFSSDGAATLDAAITEVAAGVMKATGNLVDYSASYTPVAGGTITSAFDTVFLNNGSYADLGTGQANIAAGVAGQHLRLVQTGAGATRINSGATPLVMLPGVGTSFVMQQYDVVEMVCDGTNWMPMNLPSARLLLNERGQQAMSLNDLAAHSVFQSPVTLPIGVIGPGSLIIVEGGGTSANSTNARTIKFDLLVGSSTLSFTTASMATSGLGRYFKWRCELRWQSSTALSYVFDFGYTNIAGATETEVAHNDLVGFATMADMTSNTNTIDAKVTASATGDTSWNNWVNTVELHQPR